MTAVGTFATRDAPDPGTIVSAGTAEQLDLVAGVRRARELRTNEQLSEAEETIGGVLAIEPANVAALVELGHIRRTARDYPGAVSAFQSAAAASPRHIGVRDRARSTSPARRSTRRSRGIAGGADRGRARLRRRFCRARSLPLAGAATAPLHSTAFERAAAIDPANTGVALERATELRALERTGEAETILRDLRCRAEATAPATSLGNLLIETNRPAEAEGALHRAPQADPTNGRIALALAKVAKQLGDRTETARRLGEALATDPANLGIRVGLAAELREQESAERGGGGDPRRTAPERQRTGAPGRTSRILRATDDRRGAARSLDRAAAKAEIAVDLLVDVAREKRALADQAGAEAALRLALERQPGHLGALLALAEFALQAGDPGDALGFAEHAIVAHPGQLGPYLLGARAAAAISNRERSAELLDEARSRFGERPAIAAMQIHILRGMQDFTSALQVVAGIDEASASPDLWAERTALAIAVGDFAAAERALAQPPTISEEPRFHFSTAHSPRRGATTKARRRTMPRPSASGRRRQTGMRRWPAPAC